MFIYDFLKTINTITETQTADIGGHRRVGNDTKNDFLNFIYLFWLLWVFTAVCWLL